MKHKLKKKEAGSNRKKAKKANTGRRYSKSEKKRILKDSESKTFQELKDIYGVTVLVKYFHSINPDIERYKNFSISPGLFDSN